MPRPSPLCSGKSPAARRRALRRATRLPLAASDLLLLSDAGRPADLCRRAARGQRRPPLGRITVAVADRRSFLTYRALAAGLLGGRLAAEDELPGFLQAWTGVWRLPGRWGHARRGFPRIPLDNHARWVVWASTRQGLGASTDRAVVLRFIARFVNTPLNRGYRDYPTSQWVAARFAGAVDLRRLGAAIVASSAGRRAAEDHNVARALNELRAAVEAAGAGAQK